MKHRALWPAAVALALAGCSGAPDETTSERTATAAAALTTTLPKAAAVVKTVALGAQSTFYFKTLPKATCSIYGADPTAGQPLMADDNGFVRLSMTGTAEGTESLTVDCTDDSGAGLSHPLNVRVTSDATTLAAAAHQDTAILTAPAAVGVARPPLAGDPSQYTDDQLVAGGYGHRPDQKLQASRYSDWLRAVTQPATLVSERQVPLPKARSGTAYPNLSGYSKIWSGYVANIDGSQLPNVYYSQVGANWGVPQIQGDSYDGASIVSQVSNWVGLDGYQLPYLWQAGQQTENYTFFGAVLWTNNFAWTEYLPPQVNEVGVSNFTVNTYDAFVAWIWVCDNYGNLPTGPNYSATNRCVWLHNFTNGSDYLPGGTGVAGTNPGLFSNAPFTGATAEVVVERPDTCNGQGCYDDLSNFGKITFPTPQACISSAGSNGYFCDLPWIYSAQPAQGWTIMTSDGSSTGHWLSQGADNPYYGNGNEAMDVWWWFYK